MRAYIVLRVTAEALPRLQRCMQTLLKQSHPASGFIIQLVNKEEPWQERSVRKIEGIARAIHPNSFVRTVMTHAGSHGIDGRDSVIFLDLDDDEQWHGDWIRTVLSTFHSGVDALLCRVAENLDAEIGKVVTTPFDGDEAVPTATLCIRASSLPGKGMLTETMASLDVGKAMLLEEPALISRKPKHAHTGSEAASSADRMKTEGTSGSGGTESFAWSTGLFLAILFLVILVALLTIGSVSFLRSNGISSRAAGAAARPAQRSVINRP